MSRPFAFSAATNLLAALELDPRVGETLTRLGLKCIDRRGEWCAAVISENLADAALYHDVPLETILAELNRLNLPPKP
jgi:hypothetical protein